MLFIALTARRIESTRCCVTAITCTGFLSAVSWAAHMAVPPSGMPPSAFPFQHFLMTVPGVTLGSMVGPYLARALGKSNVMSIFVCVVAADIVQNILNMWQ